MPIFSTSDITKFEILKLVIGFALIIIALCQWKVADPIGVTYFSETIGTAFGMVEFVAFLYGRYEV